MNAYQGMFRCTSCNWSGPESELDYYGSHIRCPKCARTAEPLCPETPLRRCTDCFFDLQATACQAIGRCPMFGKDRQDAEVRCEKFRPRLEDQA